MLDTRCGEDEGNKVQVVLERGSRSSARDDGDTVVGTAEMVSFSSVLSDHSFLSICVPARLNEGRTLQAIMELVRSQSVTAISAPWSRCFSGERKLSQPEEAYRIDRFRGKGCGPQTRTMRIRTILKMFDKDVT